MTADAATQMFSSRIGKPLKAIAKVGLGNGMTLVDDAGQVVEGVDTFYGIIDEGMSADNPLRILFDQAFG